MLLMVASPKIVDEILIWNAVIWLYWLENVGGSEIWSICTSMDVVLNIKGLWSADGAK